MAGVEQLYPQRVRAVALQDPDRVFLQHVDGRFRTYGEVRERSEHIANAVDALVDGSRSRVATLMVTGLEYAEVTLGLSLSRAVEVPVNTALRGRTLAHVFQDSRAAALIISDRFLEVLDSVDPDVIPMKILVVPEPGSDTIEVTAGERPWASRISAFDDAVMQAPRGPVNDPQPHDTAWILYTSGTTGPAKGVVCTWMQTYLTATGVYPFDDLSADDVYYTALPMFHVAGRVGPYLAALLGTRCVTRESFSTSAFWDDIRTYGCTTTQMFPAMVSFLEAQERRSDDTDNPLRNTLIAPVVPTFREFSERFGVRVCTTWNMTETSCPIVSDGFDITDQRSCGRARPGYELRIVDEHDIEVPDGELGELIVRASVPHALMAGYWGLADKTVEAWRDLWFHTGDAFTRDADGNYFFVDRRKDALRRRGENISSLDVEVDILSHPEVEQAAVIGVPSPQGEEEVMACVVVAPGSMLTPETLLQYLEPIMPRFMLPRFVEFFDELPQTATFRVQKNALRERGVQPSAWDRQAASESAAPAATK